MATTGIALTPVVGSPAILHPSYTPSPATQRALPTPSPFQISSAVSPAASSKRGFDRLHDLGLRFLALLFAFVSAIVIAAATPRSRSKGGRSVSLLQQPEFRYCSAAAIIASIYSAIQLCKGIWEVAFIVGLPVSDKILDYATFILDQIVTYLLLSSSSVAVAGLQKIREGDHKNAAIVSVCTSFAAFVVVAVSTIYSGYKLCNRIIW